MNHTQNKQKSPLSSSGLTRGSRLSVIPDSIRNLVKNPLTLGFCVIALLFGANILFAQVAHASVPFPYFGDKGIISCTGAGEGGTDNKQCDSFCDVLSTGNNILTLGISIALFIIVPVFVIWGGVLIMTAGANEGNVKSGKDILKGVAYGVAIILGGYLLVKTFIIILALQPREDGSPYIKGFTDPIDCQIAPYVPPDFGSIGEEGPPDGGLVCETPCDRNSVCEAGMGPGGSPGCVWECVEPECEEGEVCTLESGPGTGVCKTPPGGGGSGGTCSCTGSFTGGLVSQTTCNLAKNQYNLNCSWTGSSCDCSGPVPCVSSESQCNVSGVKSACGVPDLPGVTFTASCSWQSSGGGSGSGTCNDHKTAYPNSNPCQDGPSVAEVVSCVARGLNPTTWQGTHNINSCHFGGRTCNDGSHAVDYGFNDLRSKSIDPCDAKAIIEGCGASVQCRYESQGGAQINLSCSDPRANHLHCNVDNASCGCN